jgi:hypothetical protein
MNEKHLSASIDDKKGGCIGVVVVGGNTHFDTIPSLHSFVPQAPNFFLAL